MKLLIVLMVPVVVRVHSFEFMSTCHATVLCADTLAFFNKHSTFIDLTVVISNSCWLILLCTFPPHHLWKSGAFLCALKNFAVKLGCNDYWWILHIHSLVWMIFGRWSFQAALELQLHFVDSGLQLPSLFQRFFLISKEVQDFFELCLFYLFV